MSPPNWFAGRRFISLIVASSSPIRARRSSFSGIARPFGARHEIRPALRPVEIKPVILHVLALHHVASLEPENRLVRPAAGSAGLEIQEARESGRHPSRSRWWTS